MRFIQLGGLALAALTLAPACHIYFDDDDDPCVLDSREPDVAGLFNPETLRCEDPYGGGCGYEDRDIPTIAYDWASCYTECNGLPEGSCLQADGCRAIYSDRVGFQECVATAPSGPVRGGFCQDFDAWECSRHDDCVAFREGTSGGFLRCATEPGTCLPTPPGVPPPPPHPGLRNPETGQCEFLGGGGGGGGCGPGTGSGFDPAPLPDWGLCASACTGLDEATCKASDACRAIYGNEFPPNTDGVSFVYKECWPTAPSGPVRGGECRGLDAQTCSMHDDCVAQHESDWSQCSNVEPCDWTLGRFRHCEAENRPPPPPPACETLAEGSCIGRADCEPFYSGHDCSCTPSGCDCQTWTFELCETRN